LSDGLNAVSYLDVPCNASLATKHDVVANLDRSGDANK